MSPFEKIITSILSLSVGLMVIVALITGWIMMSTLAQADQLARVESGLSALANTPRPLMAANIPGVVLQGQAKLQGHRDHQGITVTIAERQIQTGSEGKFEVEVAGPYVLTLTAPGYLSARAEGDSQTMTYSGSSPINLGRVTLLAGEVTGDERIDITDLTFIANHFGRYDMRADLNDDGVVNIFDLALAASNYQQRGPIIKWQL